MIEVGKSYRVVTVDYATGDKVRTEAYGKCVYINPRGRFATLEMPGGWKESFHFDDIYKWMKGYGLPKPRKPKKPGKEKALCT